MKRGGSSKSASKNFMKSMSTDDIIICVLLIVLVVLVVFYICQNSKSESFKDKDTTIYFFYVDWCPHCRNAKPLVEKLKEKVNVVSVNCEENPDKAEEHGIEAYPTFMKEQNGSKVPVGLNELLTEYNIPKEKN